MGSILAKDAVDLARRTLQDGDRTRWDDSELLQYLNEGQREICILRPDAYIEVRNIALQISGTLQTLPVDATSLVKITRNMGLAGTTAGRPIRLAMQDELDRADPNWHLSSTNSAVKGYTYDGKSPKVFYVTPYPAVILYVEAHLRCPPPNCTINGVDGATINSAISIDDIYSTGLHDFMMMRAKRKDGDAQDEASAQTYYTQFLQRLGLKVVADKSFDPNRSAPPATRAPDGGQSGQPNF